MGGVVLALLWRRAIETGCFIVLGCMLRAFTFVAPSAPDEASLCVDASTRLTHSLARTLLAHILNLATG